MVEDENGVFACDNCGYTEVYYDEDFEYESRKNGDYD